MSRSTNPEAAAELELLTGESPVDITTLAPANLPAIFDGYRAMMEAVRERALAIKVTDVSQTGLMEEAKRLCKQLAATRIQAEKKRVEEVSPLKKITSKIDSTVKAIRDGCEILEAHLEKQYQFVMIQEAQARAALIRDREDQLAEYGVDAVAAAMYNLVEMTDEQFDALLVEKHRAQKYLHQQQKEERERQEAEAKREADERAAQAAENARLKKESAEKDRQLAEERAARAHAERLAEIAAQDARQQAPVPATALPAGTTDKERLLRYAAEIRSIPLPELSGALAHLAAKLLSNVLNFIAWIEKKADEL